MHLATLFSAPISPEKDTAGSNATTVTVTDNDGKMTVPIKAQKTMQRGCSGAQQPLENFPHSPATLAPCVSPNMKLRLRAFFIY